MSGTENLFHKWHLKIHSEMLNPLDWQIKFSVEFCVLRCALCHPFLSSAKEWKEYYDFPFIMIFYLRLQLVEGNPINPHLYSAL